MDMKEEEIESMGHSRWGKEEGVQDHALPGSILGRWSYRLTGQEIEKGADLGEMMNLLSDTSLDSFLFCLK